MQVAELSRSGKQTNPATQTWLSHALCLNSKQSEYCDAHCVFDDLLVSAPGNGGLFVLRKAGWLTPPTITTVDWLATTGLSMTENCLFRGMPLKDHGLIYGYPSTGRPWPMMIDGVSDIHDLYYYENSLYVVSTGSNSVVRVSIPGGEVIQKWELPGETDSWHLNCVDIWDGKLVATAFGRYSKTGEYKQISEANGLVLDMETKETIWDGLRFPHTPRVDKRGRYFVCDSVNHRLLMKDKGQIKTKEWPGYFVRGLAFGASSIYVGLSAKRHTETPIADNAKIAVLRMDDLSPLGEVTLPSPEVYDIVVLPDSVI
jgi:hypothetical protein